MDGQDLITDRLPLTEIARAYERVCAPDSIKVIVQP
jgi:hypothetical protein